MKQLLYMRLLNKESDFMLVNKKFKIRYLVIMIVLIYFGSIYYNQAKMISGLNKDLYILEEKISDLNIKRDMKKDQLENIQKYMLDDEQSNTLEAKAYIENIARNEGLVRTGEIIFIDEDKELEEAKKKFYNNSVK